MFDHRSQFMNAIRDNPSDEANRLVFADWLEENNDVALATELRAGKVPFMLRRGDGGYDGKFQESIIAQDDDNDYSESGYVVVRIGNWCAIASYSHCSCYGTWASITGGGISDEEGDHDPRWDWQGTYAQLLDMAARCADPCVPERSANKNDSDYDHLQEVYKQVLKEAGKFPPA